jgi:hypothetical protein
MTANHLAALLQSLDAVGDYLLPHDTLFADMNLRLSIRLTPTEFEKLLTEQEKKHRIISQRDEFQNVKYKITDNGRARLAELR